METKTELIYNPCFGNIKKNNNKSKLFLSFLKQANYKDVIFINNKNCFICGDITGFNHAFVYVAHSNVISEFSWDKVKYIEKGILLPNIDIIEEKNINKTSNIIAVIITIIIFFATFIMGMIYSVIPLLFK